MNVKKIFVRIALVILTGVLTLPVVAQSQYWVFFKDKQGVEFNPYNYFDQKTIEKRKRLGISLVQHTDLPVKEEYIEHVRRVAGSTIFVSRWFNGVIVDCADRKLERIADFPFVETVQPVARRNVKKTSDGLFSFDSEDLLSNQLARFGDSIFYAQGYDGTGVRIAVLDAGFPGVNTHPAFSHLFDEGRIIETYDFVQEDTMVYDHSSHGTMVLSCIAGKYGNENIGLATGAEFLLARTERSLTEPVSEEKNWFEATEWADKHGADIISSSLGYSYHRYFKQEMNGRSSLVSKAANIAASKGIFVVVSMGNEGTSRWQVLVTPADADSVVSVGGIHPNTGIHTPFSSFGPTADKRLKPNVTAYGHAMVAKPEGYGITQGTSFSAPLVSGFAACVWQQHPEWDNMKLKQKLSESGDLYPYYDYAHGYGVPQAGYFVENAPSTEAIDVELNITINDDHIIIEAPDKKLDAVTSHYSQLFYHVEHPDGYLQKFGVAELKRGKTLKIKNEPAYSGSDFRIYFKEVIKEKQIP